MVLAPFLWQAQVEALRKEAMSVFASWLAFQTWSLLIVDPQNTVIPARWFSVWCSYAFPNFHASASCPFEVIISISCTQVNEPLSLSEHVVHTLLTHAISLMQLSVSCHWGLSETIHANLIMNTCCLFSSCNQADTWIPYTRTHTHICNHMYIVYIYIEIHTHI